MAITICWTYTKLFAYSVKEEDEEEILISRIRKKEGVYYMSNKPNKYLQKTKADFFIFRHWGIVQCRKIISPFFVAIDAVW